MKTTVERPAESAGGLHRQADVLPERFFRALGRLDETDSIKAVKTLCTSLAAAIEESGVRA